MGGKNYKYLVSYILMDAIYDVYLMLSSLLGNIS